jgi:phosphohistidine phosphatase
MMLVLVHHGEAVEPLVDVRRPLSAHGERCVVRLAGEAAARGVSPAVVWHSGKLRARQTAEAFWRACNALATFSASRDLQPDDSPVWLRDRLRGETKDILIAGHYPHLPRLGSLLVGARDDAPFDFPLHGVVAFRSDDQGETWTEAWRLADSP